MNLHKISSIFAVAGCLLVINGCASTRQVAKNEPPPVETKPAAPISDLLSDGYALEAAQQWPQAVAFYGGVLKDQPANATALHRLGVIATIRGENEAAASYYRRAMELDPRNATLLADTGYFLSLQKQYEPAALLLQKAQLLEPDNELVLNNLAVVQGLRGEIDAALVLFRRVNPPAVALQNLAALHEQRGEWQLALACYLEAQSVDPDVAIPEAVVAKVEERRRGEPDVNSAATVAEPETTITDHVADAPLVGFAPPPSRPVSHTTVPVETVAEIPVEPETEAAIFAEPTPTIESDADFFPADFLTTSTTDSLESRLFDDEEAMVTPASATVAAEDAESQLEEISSPRIRDMALDGCCPVALRDTAQLIDGRPEFCTRYQGVLYTFSSAEAVQRFRKQPERYAPSAGGLDVIAVRSGRMERGSLHYSTWFRNRLYLFTSAERVDEFRSDPLRYVDLD